MSDSNHTPASRPLLGLLAPKTGIVSLYGQEISWAAEIAVSEINEAGGVLGQKLDLAVVDDGSMPQTAVPAARRLLAQGCQAIIGNLLTNSRIAVAEEVCLPRQVPQLNFSFSEGAISNPWFFHYAALPNQQIDKMIPYMVADKGPKFFFAGSNYEWPRGSIDAAKRALRRAGGELVGEEYFPLGRADFKDLLDKVALSGADVFVPYFAGTEQLDLLTRFHDRGLKKRMSVVMGHYDEIMLSNLPPAVRAGFYSSNTYFMSVDTPESQRYLKRLAALKGVTGIWPKGNGILTNFGEGVYVCVKAFAQAANAAGSLDRNAIRSALENGSIDSPQGPVEMDANLRHAQINSYLARSSEQSGFEIVRDFGPIAPSVPHRYQSQPTSSANDQKDLDVRHQQPVGSVVPDDLRRILDVTDIGVLSTDETGKILEANHHICQLFGYTREELTGMSVHLLVPPAKRSEHPQHLAELSHSSSKKVMMGERGEIAGYRKDGSEFPAEASIMKYQNSAGQWSFVVTLRDISDRIQAQEQLLWQATHDSLTGLPNRSLMRERLEHALDRSVRSGKNVALLFVDLDGFKLINDTYGHDVGDELIKAVGNTLLETVRAGDTVARFGGDEFVILCENLNSDDIVGYQAERIVERLRKPIIVDNLQLFATASIGLAVGGGQDHSAESLLKNADAAMYRAKDEGRDGWTVFSPDIHDRAKGHLAIANGLRDAIANQELEAVFQPIVDTRTQTIVGAETLLRWHSPEGLIPPDVFIPIAEASGTIHALGRWVFEEACKMQVRISHSLPLNEDAYVSVNVSTREMAKSEYMSNMVSILWSTGANPSQLLLEITESAIMENIEDNMRLLKTLANLGLNCAIDDFGTGYSSLALLNKLPLDCLKVDRLFVNGLHKGGTDLALTSAVVGMAKALNLKVIAEGVETVDQLNVLKDIGCSNAQGYLFHKPMPADDFIEKLVANREDQSPNKNINTQGMHTPPSLH